MRFDEIAPQKPLSPEQARLKSMKDRVKRDQQAVKAERARQKIKAGQAELAFRQEIWVAESCVLHHFAVHPPVTVGRQ